MADLRNAPSALRTLYGWLVQNGFTVLKDAPGGAFNQYVVLGKGAVQIAIRADRGDWDLTVSLDTGKTHWQIDQLQAYLDRHPWIGDPSSDDHKAEFVRSRLDELEIRWRTDQDVYKELNRIGDQWMSWRLGIPIPEGGFPRGKSN